MQNLGIGEAAHKASLIGASLAFLILGVATAASAQSSSSSDGPSEAAKRAAASPYRFILQSSTAPRKPAPAAAPAVAEPKKPSAPAVQQASVQPRETQQPSRPAVAADPGPAPSAPAPEPAVASLSRQATEPPPVRREIIPVKTDEPRLSPALLREEPHGTVKVHFDINYDGSVGEVKVVSSSNRALNKPTIEAVQGWKFQPVDEQLTVETEIVYKFDKDK